MYMYIFFWEGVILGLVIMLLNVWDEKVHGIQSDRLWKAIIVFRWMQMHIYMYYIGAYSYLLVEPTRPQKALCLRGGWVGWIESIKKRCGTYICTMIWTLLNTTSSHRTHQCSPADRRWSKPLQEAALKTRGISTQINLFLKAWTWIVSKAVVKDTGFFCIFDGHPSLVLVSRT